MLVASACFSFFNIHTNKHQQKACRYYVSAILSVPFTLSRANRLQRYYFFFTYASAPAFFTIFYAFFVPCS